MSRRSGSIDPTQFFGGVARTARMISEAPLGFVRLCADFVEKLAADLDWAPIGRAQLLERDQLSELPEVLSRCGEAELVLGAVRSPQPKPIQLEDPLEVGKQHGRGRSAGNLCLSHPRSLWTGSV